MFRPASLGATFVILLSFIVLGGCNNRPQPVVSNVTRQEHPEFINGEMDWGSEVTCDVTNKGVAGMVHVNVTLSSSEGEWSRNQEIMLGEGETRRLTYFFQEPTINATNLQALVRVQ